MFLHALLLGGLATFQISSATDAWAEYVAAEERTTTEPRSAEAWLELGDSLIRVADTGAYGAAGIWWEDARGAFEHALAEDPVSVAAVEALYDVAVALDDDVGVVSWGERLLGALVTEQGALPPDVLAEVLRSRARMPRPTADQDPAGHSTALEGLARRLEHARHLLPEAPQVALARADILADLGQADRSLAVLAAGLSAAPDSIALHGAFIERSAANGRRRAAADIYDTLAREHPAEALVWWYRGSLQVLLAEQALSEHRLADARIAVGRAVGWLSRCGDLEAGYADAVRQSRARARGLLGWCALGESDIDGALAAWIDVLATDPDLCGMADGLGRSVLGGLAQLGAHHDQVASYKAGAELCRAVLAVQPDSGEWWNNLAFFLRQRGAQEVAGFIAVEGDAEVVSQRTFRESWEAYLQAIERAPDDVRILNDCALMQIYHLRDELERAEGMLHRAVAMGQEQLDVLGPYASESEIFPVSQAVGDAWENLGYAAYHLHDDPDGALAFFEKSLATDSGYRPGVEQFIEAIRGELPPLEERPASSDARPQVEVAGGGARPTWAWSYEAARENSRAAGLPLLVYHRGEGLGLMVPWFDQIVLRDDVVARLADVACVLADNNRHTPLDRTLRGEAIPCPEFGGPPCGVHIANAEAFAQDWRAQHDGADPGAAEEGVLVYGPDGEPLTETINEWFMALINQESDADWREMLGQARDDAVLETWLDQLARPGDDQAGAAVALSLLADETPGARRAAEWALMDPATNGSARHRLVAGLADREELDLLGALCTRDEDPELVSLVLDAWPAREDPSPLMNTLLFASSPPVRRLAAQNLERVDPGSRTRELLVARRLLGAPEDQLIAAEVLGRLAADD